MLLSLRDRLLICLSPQRISVLRLRKRLQWRAVDHRQQALPQGAMQADAVQALSHLLVDMDCSSCDATIVLAGGWVHYMLLNWDDALSGAKESEAFVRLKYLGVYGEVAKGWDFRWSLVHPGQMVASAIDGQLLSGVRALLKSQGIHLVSIQPYLMTAFNKWTRQIHQEDCWLVLQEPGRVILSFHESSGRWLSLHAERFAEMPGETLQHVMRREGVRSGLGGKADTAKVWLTGRLKSDRAASGDEFLMDYPAGLDPLSHSDYFMLLAALS